jgi:hypothetical protein
VLEFDYQAEFVKSGMPLDSTMKVNICFKHHSKLAANVNFIHSLQQYIAACEGTEPYGNKDWNVPKFHSRRHAFDHIEKKGASRNFGTKTSESMHGAIRKTYLRLTNVKDVTPQAS